MSTALKISKTRKEDIHKRPQAKFQQDIARQLGLIK